MLFEEITRTDIDEIKELQPEGWPDITIAFNSYIEKDFCIPIKAIIEGCIVGIGSSIKFDNTAWLAHIIVREESRNKGIGYEMVKYLISDPSSKQIDTFLLIANDLGEPVYKKVGFKTISDYLFLERESVWRNKDIISSKITPYTNLFYNQILELDKTISGENRELLLNLHMKQCMIYQENSKIHGVFMPDLGEGLIIANSSVIGIELMKLKYAKVNKAVIPAENKIGLEFLIQNGFKLLNSKGRKMILGKDIIWKPECYFSRIGGNYG